MDKIEFKDKLVSINRITKVVKGGRRFSFSALIVVGNGAGSIGIGHAKAKHHDILAKDGAGKVLMKSAPSGTGIIAGGAIRAACEVVGIKDVVAKSIGSSNPLNVLRACIKGLKNQNSPKYIAYSRGKDISEITKKKQ